MENTEHYKKKFIRMIRDKNFPDADKIENVIRRKYYDFDFRPLTFKYEEDITKKMNGPVDEVIDFLKNNTSDKSNIKTVEVNGVRKTILTDVYSEDDIIWFYRILSLVLSDYVKEANNVNGSSKKIEDISVSDRETESIGRYKPFNYESIADGCATKVNENSKTCSCQGEKNEPKNVNLIGCANGKVKSCDGVSHENVDKPSRKYKLEDITDIYGDYGKRSVCNDKRLNTSNESGKTWRDLVNECCDKIVEDRFRYNNLLGGTVLLETIDDILKRKDKKNK